MDLEGIILSKINHTEKEKFSMIFLIHRIKKQKQKQTNKQTNKQKQAHRYKEETESCQKGERGIDKMDKRGLKRIKFQL